MNNQPVVEEDCQRSQYEMTTIKCSSSSRAVVLVRTAQTRTRSLSAQYFIPPLTSHFILTHVVLPSAALSDSLTSIHFDLPSAASLPAVVLIERCRFGSLGL